MATIEIYRDPSVLVSLTAADFSLLDESLSFHLERFVKSYQLGSEAISTGKYKLQNWSASNFTATLSGTYIYGSWSFEGTALQSAHRQVRSIGFEHSGDYDWRLVGSGTWTTTGGQFAQAFPYGRNGSIFFGDVRELTLSGTTEFLLAGAMRLSVNNGLSGEIYELVIRLGQFDLTERGRFVIGDAGASQVTALAIAHNGAPVISVAGKLSLQEFSWVQERLTSAADLLYDTQFLGGNDLIKIAIGGGAWGGFGGNDTLIGSAGNDVLDGGDGSDTVTAGSGDDALIASAGSDRLDGGVGVDRVYFSNARAGITVNLATGSAQSRMGGDVAGIGLDKLKNIEEVGGSDFDDILIGNQGENFLEGAGGRDTLDGGLGNDVLFGGVGADRFALTTKLGATNWDVIIDFTGGSDELALSAKIFPKLKGAAQVAAHFVLDSATKSTDYLIYDTTSGRLFYDTDGVGMRSTPTQIAVFVGIAELQANDILVIN